MPLPVGLASIRPLQETLHALTAETMPPLDTTNRVLLALNGVYAMQALKKSRMLPQESRADAQSCIFCKMVCVLHVLQVHFMILDGHGVCLCQI